MTKAHWEQVYGTKAPDAVSWYAPHLNESLEFVRRTGVAAEASILDVGGGEATLVDHLLEVGYVNVQVLDISEKALEVCKGRLAERAGSVRWAAADVLDYNFAERSVDVWHDRPMNSYVHGGIRAIVQTLAGCAPQQLVNVLLNGNGLALLTSNLLVVAHADPTLVGIVRKLQARYADCMPPPKGG